MSLLLATISDEKIAQFWASVQRGSTQDCWPWVGAKDRYGYGSFYFRGHRAASRVALALSSGVEPKDQHALHSCDNPACCNPHHLRWGDAAENAADKVSRGRARGRYSEPKPILSEVSLIRGGV